MARKEDADLSYPRTAGMARSAHYVKLPRGDARK